MRIDLPCCGFKNCRYSFDGNCMKPSEQEKCEYWYLLHKELYKPEPHWTPCGERLPEKDEWNNAFLVTIQCEHVDGWEDYYVSGAEYSEYGWDYIPCPVGAIKVVAWMIVSISPYQPAPHCTDDYCEIEIEEESE